MMPMPRGGTMNDSTAERGIIPARHGAAIPLGRGSELVLVNTYGTQVSIPRVEWP